jgi:hypothetical protein
MLRKIKRLYEQYREYVRVDLILYAVLIGMIIIYFILIMLAE